MIITVDQAKEWLRVDGTDNDAIIESLINATTEYIEVATGLTETEQTKSKLAITVAKFLLTLWYNPEQAESEKLQRTIDNLLKSLNAIKNTSN